MVLLEGTTEKIPSDTSGNRSRDRPTSSAVSSQQGFGKMVENNWLENIIARLSETQHFKKNSHHIPFHSFIHSIGMCRMWQFLAVLGSFFHSSLLYTLSFHPFPPPSLSSSLASSCHLFLGLPLSLVNSNFIYNNLLGILFSSILSTCPNQHNLWFLVIVQLEAQVLFNVFIYL